MAFNIFKWILKDQESPGPAGETISKGTFLEENIQDIAFGLEAYLQRMAFWTCVRRIGEAVAAVEWETYRRGKKVKAREYWSWNYAPNPNQTRNQFFVTLIGKLFHDQEALVVETADGSRYVAGSFSVEHRLSGDIYRDITSNGEQIPGTYLSSDVLHFTLEGTSIRKSMTAVSVMEGKLLKSAATSYIRNNGRHGILTIDDVAESDPDFEETYKELIEEKFKTYFSAENAVLPLFKGYNYTEGGSGGEGTTGRSSGSTSGSANTRDIRAIMDDVLELTASGLGLPASIATGKNVTDADFAAFLTSPVLPIVTMIAQEINRKLYGQQLVFNGTYIAPNLAAVRYRDVFDIADPIDKLIASGAFCVNDILVRLGANPIDEPWAEQHWMTKNYSPADDLLSGVDSNKNEPATPPGPGKEETKGEGENTNGDPPDKDPDALLQPQR